MLMLKPVDLFLLLKLTLLDQATWTQMQVASDLGLAQSEVHNSIKRCENARLLDLSRRTVRRRNLEEFIIHGVKYSFPAERGSPTIGMPTGYAAPPLANSIINSGNIPVWPDPEGPAQGYSFTPLHKSAVAASRRDKRLYELLALVDAIRDGRARETEIARTEIADRLKVTD